MNPVASRITLGLLVLAFLFVYSDPVYSQPTEQHGLLKKFVGKWDAKIELKSKDQPNPIQIAGVETNAMLGDYWIVSDLSIGNDEGTQTDFRKWTIGYSPKESKFHGFYANMASPYHENQTGKFDQSSSTLTLMTDYRNQETGAPVQGKRVIEFLSDDRRRLTLFQKNDAGEFEPIAKVEFSRNKK